MSPITINHFNMEIEPYETFLETAPPAQNSPAHILNILNDDCIKEILKRLKNRRDFLNAANVCKRFQYVAQTWLSHKTLQIGGKSRKSSTSTIVIDHRFLSDLYAYLSIFGECIRNIKWFIPIKTTENTCAEVFKMIANFCGKTLIRLDIIGRTEISITTQFKVLERFEFHYGALDHFEPPRSLKYLRLTQLNKNSYFKINLSCLEKKFPNLLEAHLGDFTNLMPTTNWFTSFIKCNPQLEKLTLIANEHFVPYANQMIHGIGKHLINLESLHLDMFPVNVKSLNGLNKLKCLRIPFGYLRKQQIDTLVAFDLPIEELEASLKTGDTYVAERISKLKKIKSLNLEMRYVKGRSVSNVIDNLPPLDNLNIRGVDVSKMQEIKNCSKNIKKITNE